MSKAYIQSEQVKKAEEAAFVRGYGCAIATLARAFGDPSLAKMVSEEAGFRLKDYKVAKVDDFDLNIIREMFE